uniref:Uncharacterized protein n=1 Tax=Leptocylindrus aporus TaxID=1398097 RepID=A0A6T5W266_9STRA|mmetsp:Transcript_497/g.659  ORF Transcript_497/g.659 Transcript_497/m.659 type:complete len:404 (+) Transcript_497:88-1299(+)
MVQQRQTTIIRRSPQSQSQSQPDGSCNATPGRTCLETARYLARKKSAEKELELSNEKLSAAKMRAREAKSEHVRAWSESTVKSLDFEPFSPQSIRRLKRSSRVMLNDVKARREEKRLELEEQRTLEKNLYLELDRVRKLVQELEVELEKAEAMVVREEEKEVEIERAIRDEDHESMEAQFRLLHSRFDCRDESETKKDVQRANLDLRVASSEQKHALLKVRSESAANNAYLLASTELEGRANARAARKDFFNLTPSSSHHSSQPSSTGTEGKQATIVDTNEESTRVDFEEKTTRSILTEVGREFLKVFIIFSIAACLFLAEDNLPKKIYEILSHFLRKVQNSATTVNDRMNKFLEHDMKQWIISKLHHVETICNTTAIQGLNIASNMIMNLHKFFLTDVAMQP